MNGSRSVRGFVLALLCYAGVRTLVVWTADLRPAASPAVAARPAARFAAPGHTDPALGHLPLAVVVPPLVQQAATVLGTVPTQASAPPPPVRSASVGTPAPSAVVAVSSRPRSAPIGPLPHWPEARPLAGRPTPTAPGPSNVAAVPPAAPVPASSRWSGYAYVFHRADRGTTAALAPVGQIGGSQAAARIAYRIGATPLALAARIASPLRATHGAEAAAGLDLIAAPGLRIGVERRIALGRDGRNAFAAYTAGGLYRALSDQVELDGYGQAGVVGARRRDAFVDGAVRVNRRAPVGPWADLRFGAGAWGAAKPGAARLDIGPRMAVTTRAGRTARLPVTLAVEGRFRIAGRARPGNGIALTLASDF